MRKTSVFLIMALALAVTASLTVNQVNTASAQGVPAVGVVVTYVPGQSITIINQHGEQLEFSLAPSLKILPPKRADSLGVGSFVTIIAPASFGNGKQTAVGIVVHPHVPNGWNVPIPSATPLATNTATPTGTVVASETATSTATVTPTSTDTATSTATATTTATETTTSTATATATSTATPTATPAGGGTTTLTTNQIIEWLRTLFQQLLTNS